MFQMLREFAGNESGASAIDKSLFFALLSVTLVAILAA
jgi:Flp pilus assembly pilin Flp